MSFKGQKRKCDSTSNSAKSTKFDEIKPGNPFLEKDVPEGLFPIGEEVFVYPNTFQSNVSLQIQKFHKYGEKYYPTKEGISLRPWWATDIIGRKSVPQTKQQLRTIFEHELTIESNDFAHFKFTRLAPNGEPRSITLSAEQWTEMIRQQNAITNALLDHVFREMDFLNAYSTITNTTVAKSTLPASLDTSLGTHYLHNVLESVLCKMFKDKGLKDPEMLAEELHGNRIENFNSLALAMDVLEMAEEFRENLWEDPTFLCMKPAMYVTEHFLKHVELNKVLSSVREKLCPSDAFEYFE